MGKESAQKRISEQIEKIKESTTAETDKLRLQQKELIKTLKYEEATEIAKQIEEINKHASENKFAVIRNEFIDDLNENLELKNAESDDLEQQKKYDELNIKIKYDEMFDDLKKQQIERLYQFEQQFLKEREIEFNRRDPEQIELRESSIRAAENGDFDTAMKLRDEAVKLGLNKMEKKTEQMNKLFETRRNELMNKFGQEILGLTRQLNTERATYVKKHTDKLVDVKSTRESALSALCQQYMKIVAKYVQDDTALRCANELQELYITFCKDNGLKPAAFHVEQNLNTKKKLGKTAK